MRLCACILISGVWVTHGEGCLGVSIFVSDSYKLCYELGIRRLRACWAWQAVGTWSLWSV